MAWLGRGAALMASGQLDRGIAAYDRAISRISQEPLSYELRGRALVAKGQFDRAIADFDQALKLNSRYPEALVGRGLARMQKRNYAQAMADVDEALSMRPSIEGHYVRAQIYEREGKTDHAMADLKKAIGLEANTAFEAAAQADARKRLDGLSRRTPCRQSDQTGAADTCL
jgi:tetratricopeptide (TPR) repeat protein